MNPRAARLATIHMSMNLIAVVLYIITFFLRLNAAAFQIGRWGGAMALEVIALVILGTSGWLGGQMAYVHRVGVIEPASNPNLTPAAPPDSLGVNVGRAVRGARLVYTFALSGSAKGSSARQPLP